MYAPASQMQIAESGFPVIQQVHYEKKKNRTAEYDHMWQELQRKAT